MSLNRLLEDAPSHQGQRDDRHSMVLPRLIGTHSAVFHCAPKGRRLTADQTLPLILVVLHPEAVCRRIVRQEKDGDGHDSQALNALSVKQVSKSRWDDTHTVAKKRQIGFADA